VAALGRSFLRILYLDNEQLLRMVPTARSSMDFLVSEGGITG
jgi:hypothetical protein